MRNSYLRYSRLPLTAQPPQPRRDQPVAGAAKAQRDKTPDKAVCSAVDPKDPNSNELDACKQLQFKKPGK